MHRLLLFISLSLASSLLAFSTQSSLADGLSVTRVAVSDVPLSNPHDLKLSPDGQELYVSDVGNDRVAVLDPDSLQLLWSFGADHQDGTHDIDFDSQGQAYVADTHNNRVTIYRIGQQRAQLISEISEGIRGPEGVLAHPNGLLYVAGAWSGNLVAYREGKKVNELSNLSAPHDLALRSDGDIWLSDSGNSRILHLSQDLQIKAVLSRNQYDFDGVRYMDVMDDGTLIAADKNNHQVKFIAATGQLLLTLGDGKPGVTEGRFSTPEGVEYKDGVIWISDSGNDRIVKYRVQFSD